MVVATLLVSSDGEANDGECRLKVARKSVFTEDIGRFATVDVLKLKVGKMMLVG